MVTRDVILRDTDGSVVDLAKQEAENSDLNYDAVKSLDPGDFLIQQLDYDSASKIIFLGFAIPGTATSAASWLIKSFTYDGDNTTAILFANGSTAFDQVWDDRAGLSYS